MAKRTLNDRCPLQGECEKVCAFAGHELDCKYYFDFARPGYSIDDQESIRFRREDAAMMAEYETSLDDDDDDLEDDAESPSAAENAAVAPPEPADEVLPVPAVVLPKSLHLDGDLGVTEKIKKAMYDAAKQFVYIGFLLWEVKQYHYYGEKGYSSVYDYAEAELGFKKSSTKNFIAVAETFGNRYFHSPWTRSVLPTMTLQPEYKDFNYSQLCEMLSMSDKQRAKVTPDMTVKQIRELKREGEPDLPPDMETIPIPLPDDAPESGQTSGQQSSRRSHTVNNIWADLPDDLVKSLAAVSNVRYNPRSCYDITITLHRDT